MCSVLAVDSHKAAVTKKNEDVSNNKVNTSVMTLLLSFVAMSTAATKTSSDSKERPEGDYLHITIQSLTTPTCLQYKQRKIKERYKDQDDEDKQLRMQLLAVMISLLFILIYSLMPTVCW